MFEKARVVASSLFIACLLALTSNGQATRSDNQTSHIRAVNYADLDKYGCGYVVTYDKDRVKYIAVKTILVYKDGTQQTDYIPRVFHTNREAYAECGSWRDEVEKVLSLGR